MTLSEDDRGTVARLVRRAQDRADEALEMIEAGRFGPAGVHFYMAAVHMRDVERVFRPEPTAEPKGDA